MRTWPKNAEVVFKQPVIYYVVTRERGRTWDASRAMEQQKKWAEHAAFMNALAAEGFVILGGPLGNGLKVLLIVDAASEEQITARLADDPWTRSGLLSIAQIQPWEIRLGAS